mmetsp:Transcript_24237/g.46437  ORF Transcript_24237/g.46437 Transcript_24237/m.46437 type:complete len:89 (+) Transcript_24237:130-396(+)
MLQSTRKISPFSLYISNTHITLTHTHNPHKKTHHHHHRHHRASVRLLQSTYMAYAPPKLFSFFASGIFPPAFFTLLHASPLAFPPPPY